MPYYNTGYYPTAYYPPGFYPDAIGPAPSGPDSFLEAVKTHFLAGPKAADFTGGIYLSMVSRSAPMPYCLFEITSSTLEYKSNTSEIQALRCRFKVYAEPLDTAAVLADAIQALFKGPLSFNGGWSSQWTCEGPKPQLDAYRSKPGNDVWYVSVDFRTRVNSGG